MWRTRWKCEEWDENAGARNQRGNAGNPGGNTKNVGNQGGDAGSQGGNLSIAVELTQNSNGNNKFKEWQEVKIMENEHICKNLFSHM